MKVHRLRVYTILHGHILSKEDVITANMYFICHSQQNLTHSLVPRAFDEIRQI